MFYKTNTFYNGYVFLTLKNEPQETDENVQTPVCCPAGN